MASILDRLNILIKGKKYNRDSNQERVNNFIERERHRAIVYQERRSAFAALEADRALRKFQRSRMPDQTKGGTKAK
ncbi:hypothetical protein BDV97DRAFT_85752 [Delphinella strobiligena]|nr:hypothetical protein BDV97DRAFT_85752 [Delphinella strobiligena]